MPTLRPLWAEYRLELVALAFVLAGVLCGFGTYAGSAGAVGRAANTSAGVLLGVLRFGAPVALIGGGLALLIDQPEQRRAMPCRVVVGATAALLALLGLLHVTRYPMGTDQPLAGLVRAGGGIGAIVGYPLYRYGSRAGSEVVLVALLVAALALLTKTSPRAAVNRSARILTPAGRHLIGWIQNLFRVEGMIAGDDDFADDDFADDPSGLGNDAGVAPDRPGANARAQLFDAEMPAFERSQPAVAETIEMRLPEPAPLLDREDFATPAAGVSPTWKLPPARLLERGAAQEVDRTMVERTGRVLEHALAEHGVETRLVGMVVGPTVTRYELELGPGVKVARVTSLHKDIAYAMATPDVRILAPIPGRQAIGVEVPNTKRQLVTLGDILASEEALAADHPLEVALGRDIAGRAVMANLSTMPHVLIAGATGAGKSSCINSIITSVLMRCTPDQVRMILIDPKRVELGQYNRLPHLLTQVVTNPKKAANALAWTVKEMERRYDLLSEVGVRDIGGYNTAYDRGDLAGEPSAVLRKALGRDGDDIQFPRLPYIIVVVDELNDLMMVAARDVEDSICRIAQMARAVGIHLVLATQRPSVNVITGVIKANVPARLAFAVSSLADSRVILDAMGAERLVGRGDMLMITPSSSTPQRVQAPWVSEEEVRGVAAHWRRQAPEVQYIEGVEGADDAQVSLFDGAASGGDDEDDVSLLRSARDLVVRSQLGSTSMLQRKLRVGFARAGRLMDLLEQQGVVGPSTGSKARTVHMTVEELEELG